MEQGESKGGRPYRNDQGQAAVGVFRPQEVDRRALHLLVREPREVERLGVEADRGGGIRTEACSQLAVDDGVGRQEHRVCVEQQDILPGWLLGDYRCGQQHGEHQQDADAAAADTGGEHTGPTRHKTDIPWPSRHVQCQNPATASSRLS